MAGTTPSSGGTPTNTTGVSSANNASEKSAAKPKRVRTGCLTCRERHLKCDEEMPICLNCQKSNRACKRGVRLNFIDMKVEKPPVFADSEEWSVQFLDESREIASEYKGGLAKYGATSSVGSVQVKQDHRLQQQMQTVQQRQQQHQQQHQQQQAEAMFDFAMSQVPPPAPTPQHQPLPGLPQQSVVATQFGNNTHQGFVFDTQQDHQQQQQAQHHHHQHAHSHSHSGSVHSGEHLHGAGSVSGYDVSTTINEPQAAMMSDPDETFYMQVFVEEIGCWMDSMDPQKHFSRLLPFHALTNTMLHNAFLACGARHMFLVNPSHTKEEKGLSYYNQSTSELLTALQNPNRDIVICATTAVILNVYELMGERATQRMNHIAGCRALIKECRWNALATGVGAACFWLNVGMEVLSCLHFNWQVAWDPDDWGVDMNFSSEEQYGREELWTHRMLYIIGKICSFRARAPVSVDPDPAVQAYKTQKRYDEWKHLKDLADLWDRSVPRTMQPMAHVFPWQTKVRSAFPEIWLIKRTTVVARLFYHTAMLLMAQLNPYESVSVPGEMATLQRHHAVSICGIVRHTKDRGIASVALRSIHVAGETLTDRREQDEVYTQIKQITENTGWNVRFMFEELPIKWGWTSHTTTTGNGKVTPTPSPQMAQQHAAHGGKGSVGSASAYLQHQRHASISSTGTAAAQQQAHAAPASATANSVPAQARAPARPPPRKMPQGIVNPMYAHADFSQPEHPYGTHYVPPNPLMQQVNYGFGLGFGVAG